MVFDANPYELFQSYSFNARAYDPDNLPSVTVNAEGLKEFTTQPGTPVTQTITYTTAGFRPASLLRHSESAGRRRRVPHQLHLHAQGQQEYASDHHLRPYPRGHFQR